MENENYIHFAQVPDNAEDILQEAAYGEPYGETREEWGQRLSRAFDLPDERLNKRFLQILMTLVRKPIDSLNQACHGWSEAKAAYRFVENDRVIPEDLQNPIAKAAALETTGQKVVIAVQDTTAISFDSARNAKGLGTVNDSEKARGMFYHPVLLLREDGLALGLLDQQAWCRESKVEGKAKDRRNRPIMEKESAKWLRGVAGANLALKTNLQESERPK
ncbi:MAG: transposase, partial [Deltaproteobacteria bacterium]|nr:transposase [Deltaproteobacteria bacterium]